MRSDLYISLLAGIGGCIEFIVAIIYSKKYFEKNIHKKYFFNYYLGIIIFCLPTMYFPYSYMTGFRSSFLGTMLVANIWMINLLFMENNTYQMNKFGLICKNDSMRKKIQITKEHKKKRKYIIIYLIAMLLLEICLFLLIISKQY